MSNYFDSLTKEDILTIENAFVYITLLIGEADGNLSEAEIDEAKNTIKVRGYEANHLFHELYDHINKNFESNFIKIQSDSVNADDKPDFYAREIARLNSILEKLPKRTAHLLFHDFQTFAHRIANADGGLFGFETIDKNERRYLKLPMLFPIVNDEEE